MLENRLQNSSSKRTWGFTKFHALSRVTNQGYSHCFLDRCLDYEEINKNRLQSEALEQALQEVLAEVDADLLSLKGEIEKSLIASEQETRAGQGLAV
jgi:hypothetical protein